MTYFQAIFLGVVQGITEFLPISSSGHLVLFQEWFGLTPPVLFDIFVHVGTLGAIIYYFRKELGNLQKEKNLLLLVLLGTIPVGIVGFFLQGFLGQIFNSVRLVAFSLLITAGLLLSTVKLKPKKKQLKDLKLRDVLIVGLFQALALLPGVSRSGSTIVAGLWRGMSRKTAFQFSFFIAIPAIIGALGLQLPGMLVASTEYLTQGIIGMVVAGITGYYALIILEKVLKSTRFYYFGLYCLVLGIIILFI